MINRQLRLYTVHAKFIKPDTNTKMHQDFVILAEDKTAALGMAYQRLPRYAAKHHEYNPEDPVSFKIEDIGRPYGPMTCYKSDAVSSEPEPASDKPEPVQTTPLTPARQNNPDKRAILLTQIQILWGKLSILLAETEDTDPLHMQKRYIASQMNTASVISEFNDITDRIASAYADSVSKPDLTEFIYEFLSSEFPVSDTIPDNNAFETSSDQILFGDIADTEKIETTIRANHPDKYKSRTELDTQIQKKIRLLKSRQIDIDLHSQSIARPSEIKEINRLISDKQKQDAAEAASRMMMKQQETQSENQISEQTSPVSDTILENQLADESIEIDTPDADANAVASESSNTDTALPQENIPDQTDTDKAADAPDSAELSEPDIPDDYDEEDDDMEDDLYQQADFEDNPAYDIPDEGIPDEEIIPPYEQNNNT